MGVERQTQTRPLPLLYPANQSVQYQQDAATSAKTCAQYQMELEDLLRKYEPDQLHVIDQLMEAYKGMERELVQCYRHYYTGQGGFRVTVNQSTTTSTTQTLTNKKNLSQHTFSLPKTAIETYLRAKMRKRATSSAGDAKMEGLRGPEAAASPVAPVHRRATSCGTAHVKMQHPRGGSSGGSMSSNNHEELRSATSTSSHIHNSNNRPHEDPEVTVHVKCLDTGVVMRAEDANNEILRFRPAMQSIKITPLPSGFAPTTQAAPITSQTSSSTTVTASTNNNYNRPLTFRDRVVRFLEKHDPAQLDHIDTIINYGGRTREETWEFLMTRYQANHRGRIHYLLKQHAPHKLPQLDELLQKHKGREEQFIASLREKYINKPSRRNMLAYRARSSSSDRSSTGSSSRSTWIKGSPNTYQQLPQRPQGPHIAV